jgi:hypothetical protein
MTTGRLDDSVALSGRIIFNVRPVQKTPEKSTIRQKKCFSNDNDNNIYAQSSFSGGASVSSKSTSAQCESGFMLISAPKKCEVREAFCCGHE